MPTSGETTSRRAGTSIGHTRISSLDPLVVGGMAASVACAVAGLPVAWLVLTVATVAAARGAGLRDAVERLPVAGVVVVAVTAAVVLVVGLLGMDVTSSPWSARLLLAGVGLALPPGAALRGSRCGRAGSRSWTELGLAAGPAVLVGAIGVVLAMSPLGARTSWFLSGDHLRHLGMVTRTIDAGGLEYASQTYPRAWHGVLAVLWSTTGNERDARGLAELIRLQSLASWMVLALVSLALALTAAALHRSRGGSPAANGAAGAAAGAFVLGPWFFGDYVPRGFETSILALLVLAAAVLRVTQQRADRGALVLVAVSAALMAHVWQVLVPATGALLLVVLRDRWQPRPRGRVLAVDLAILVLCSAFAAPGLLAAVRGYGLGAVSAAGDVPRPVLWWVVAIVVSVALLLASGPSHVLVPCLSSAGAALGIAVGLAAVGGVGLDSYYPSKTLWTAAALGLPLLGAAAARLFEHRGSDPRLRVPATLAVATVCGIALVSAVTPVAGVAGSWSAADGRTVIDTVTSRAAPTTTVVWEVGSDVDDATSQLLLDFYSATATTDPLGLAPRGIEAQCALLQAAERPVVMSEAPEPEVRARFACAPGLAVQRMGGGT